MSIEVHNFLNDSGGNFTETAPRPPVPGEENELQSNGGTSTRSSGSHKSQISSKSHSSGKSHKSESSPAATPRRSNLDKTSSHINRSNPKLDGEDINAPLGFEPEGSAANSPPFTENSTPQYLKWAENLNLLLEDSDGVKLFKEFLDQEHCSNTLDFWFACRGLKMVSAKDDTKITAIIKLIYRKFFKTDQLHFKPDTKRIIVDRINRKEFSQSIFDNAQKEIEDLMQSETYPLFLKSDLYVQYIQAGGDSPKTSNTSSGSNSVRPISGPLPTVQEDSVLRSEDCHADDSLNKSQPHLTLTSASLIATLASRASPYHHKEAVFMKPTLPATKVVNPYHVSYTTTSAQDSELQSLSSDAHTDDTMSQTDSSIDGRDVPYPGSKKWRNKNRMIIRQSVKHNTHTSLNQTIIPRTERAPKDRNVAETDPSKFANMLIEKLERVKEERDKIERIKESFSSLEKDDSMVMPPPVMPPAHPKSVINNSFNTSSAMNNSSMNSLQLSTLMINALAEQEEDENAQSILEDHCSRIWEGSNDQTPSRSPPGSHRSPDRNGSFRGVVAGPTPNTSGINLFARAHHKRKDKDTFSSSGSNVLSTLSYDSGMGEDRSGIYHHHSSDHKHVHHHHHHHVVGSGKDRNSAKQAEYEAQRRHMSYYRSDPNMQVRGHAEAIPGDMGDPLARGRSRDARRTSAKKTSDSSSNIDSGVSLHHYDISPHQVPNANDPSNEKVLAWMNQNDRISNSSTTQYSTDGSDKGSSQKRSSHKSVSSSASPAPHRSSRKLAGYASGRSGSMDRSGHIHLHDTSGEYSSLVLDYSRQDARHHSGVQPLQPIMQDSSMPLLNPPNPTTQLEEAKRVLEDETKQRLSKSKSFDGRSSSSKDRRSTMMAMVPPSNYPPLPPRSLPVSKSIPSGAAGPHDISSSEESSKSESKKTSGNRRPSSSAPVTPAQEVTVVGYYFCDEPIPYRTTLPGKQITLAMFKNLITKKGNYRYYFKMACEDFDAGVIMDEVSDDSATLPLWEGKIVGKVKKIE